MRFTPFKGQMAEKKGFEPLQDLHPLSVFETDPFNRLGISPASDIISYIFTMPNKIIAT